MSCWLDHGWWTRRLLLLGAFGLAVPGVAQEAVAPSGTLPSTTPSRQVELQSDHARRMTLPVYVGGQGPYPFLIDTGAQRTLLSQELAALLALPEGRTARIISLSGPAQLSTALVPHLRFGEEEVRGLVSPLVAEANLGGPGILGLDGLRGKRLVMDFVAQRMDVADSAVRPDRDADDGAIVVQARSRLGQMILVDCRVGGEKTRVILDTGAEYSIGNLALLRRLRAERMTVNPMPTMLVSVLGDAVPAQIAVVKSVTVGGVTLRDLPIIFTDAAPFQELGLAGKPVMLLGMQVMRLFDGVTIDFEHKQVQFILPSRKPDRRASR